ncbi:putative uncharacterized protein DDB_G0279653 [Hyposmocoma kahamanoa]|uniref:putative uncharacterized protein DDB_G0279653 n=1 Tax=Hyposmocoma kahamanoa TaxID=1477025 RepID=UPI000E6DA0B9|nr:putative uncharacterized protein DDB_G0279653 [Hyposmocoma kahamanoa]
MYFVLFQLDVTICGSTSQLKEPLVPKIEIKRQTKYFVFQRFIQGHANTSNDLTKEPDRTDYSNDANASTDSKTSTDIDTSTGTAEVSSETKLNLPTDIQEHKPVARSRIPLRHNFIEELRAFDKTGQHSSNHHHQVDDNAQTSYTGKSLAERQSEEPTSGERDVQKWNINHNRVTIQNINNNRGISRSIVNKKKSNKKRKPLSLISFNQIRTNNNINNNNNAPGSHNYNAVEGVGVANSMKNDKSSCWFVVCVGLYVNDAIFIIHDICCSG